MTGFAGLVGAALPATLGLSALHAADDPDVTPGPGGTGGFLGFVFTFVLALALIVLVLSLARQLRKVNHNARAAGLDAPADAEPPDTPPLPATSEREDAVAADDEPRPRAGDEGSGGATP